MNRHPTPSLWLPLCAAALTALCGNAFAQAPNTPAPSYLGRHQSTPEDLKAIEQVTLDFRAALLAHDARKLSALLLNNKILFSSPSSPTGLRKRRAEVDVNADGIGNNGAVDFLDFIASTNKLIEERFYDIKITQDGHVAWVMFDFEFVRDGQVVNHGVEAWQLVKTADDSWKILSVLWSSHGAPPAK
jgi:hypothetical protein